MNISVAMATYNGATFIREQLESLSCQTQLPHELVVCDDGSTDNTLQIVQEWASSAPFPVHVHRNKERLGHEDNFWKAANLCTGELIAFCDQDDVWYKNKVEHCAAAFNNPEVLLVMHAADLVDANLKPLGHKLPNITRSRIANPLDVNPWDSAPGFALVFSARLLRLGDWKCRPEDHLGQGRAMGHDHWVFFIASVFGRIAFLPECLGVYRRHANNTTSPIDRSQKRFLREAMHTGADTYKRMALLAQQRADYLSNIAVPFSDAESDYYQSASHYYSCLSNKMTLRARIHSGHTARLEKATHLTKLLLGGSYRCRDSGGLGARAFAKDLVCSMVVRR